MSRKGRKKHPKGRPWWRRGRTWLSVALSALLVASVAGLVAGLTLWLVAGRWSDASPPQYLDEPAPPFTLPTVDGDQISLADHKGRHNLLLFFNEGMG